MHHDDEYGRRSSRSFSETVNLYTDRAREFLRTRRNEHWVMFFAGLVIGLILG